MKKGFTLIELLVVIAIIGILASIVLVTFPTAQSRARDGRITTAIGQIRVVASSINAVEGDYGNLFCAADCSGCLDAELADLCQDILDNDGTANFTRDDTDTDGDDDAYCVFSLLNAKSSYWYCADSTGKAGFLEGLTEDPTGNNCAGAPCCADGASAVCPAGLES